MTARWGWGQVRLLSLQGRQTKSRGCRLLPLPRAGRREYPRQRLLLALHLYVTRGLVWTPKQGNVGFESLNREPEAPSKQRQLWESELTSHLSGI